MKIISVRIEDELDEELRKYSNETGICISHIVKGGIKKILNEIKEKYKQNENEIDNTKI